MKNFYFILAAFCLFTISNAQIITIPDANFKNALVTSNCADFNQDWVYDGDVDTNDDGEIQLSEALAVKILNVNNKEIAIIEGIQYFTNLYYFYISNNQISSIILPTSTTLSGFQCRYNFLTSINFDVVPNLQAIEAQYNLFTTLDFSHTKMIQAYIGNNPNLTYVNLKNGYNSNFTPSLSGNIFSIENLPALEAICLDETEYGAIQEYIVGVATSYCSFTPGGTFYTIQGNSRYDENANGCDTSDSDFPNLKFSIANGSISGTTFSNEMGNYSIPVVAGTHVVTPVLENPTYFNVSPNSTSVIFPAMASPFVQNYCITANGIHNDLEVTILPIGRAGPGFDATYKIIYKNKGTTTQSGSVNLSFDDTVLDFVSAYPTAPSQTVNNLTWNFTNLAPFETREFEVVLNVNAPTETPAVNDGDVLNYTATIVGATDDTPIDNNIVFNQIVVNSFDPNDKTCLEGNTVSPSMVGQYVHYMIRFENTGTANAQNIVVKDIIDTTKFDVSSVIPISGSHSFVSRITATNKVEFIFENINLPFDDANNDGYVAFKIKTKPTLVVGNTFSNSASIYFDYNFPIVTNTVTTTITALATQDFEFGNYFNIFPVPANNTLNIETKATIGVKSINIYNAIGQLVIAIPNAETVTNIDVSNLTTGTYFIKMNTDKGTANTKFIKE